MTTPTPTTEEPRALTKEEFESLSPTDRGYAVYMAGERDDQPNIPNEKNPYPKGTKEHEEYDQGAFMGVLEVQDYDE